MEADRPRPLPRLAMVGLVLAGATLRLWNLRGQVMGEGELRFAQDLHLSELEGRLPAVVCGLLALVVFPRMFSGRVERFPVELMGWLVALSPALVLHSRMALPYMPLALAVFVLFMALERRAFAVVGALAVIAVAAAPFLTTLTAWEALFDRMEVKGPEETLLVIAGAGGVGSIAIQIAKRVAGMRVIATASRPETEAWCRELGGRDEVIDHLVPLKDEMARIGAGEAGYILCAANTEEHLQNMVDVVRPQGKICLIVGVKGGKPVPINPFQAKSAALCWEYMFTRAVYETRDMEAQHEILDRTAGLLEDGTLRHTLREACGPLNAENLREAHAHLESGRTIGKLVLGVS